MRQADKASRIDTQTLKRDRPLADVIASYSIALRRESAGTYRALCPFHQERTPSFWVDARDPSNEHYWCFGCGAHGDVITFVMTREGCSFPEACEQLSTRARPPVLEPAQRAATHSGGRRWEELTADSVEAQVLDGALRVYQEQLGQSRRAQDYLRTRAVPDDVAGGQRLGYADGRALLQWLRRQADDRDLLQVAVTLGLVLSLPAGESSEPVYREFFVDRLIVPELRGGRPIWCIGRAIEEPATASPSCAPAVAEAAARTARPRPKYLALRGEKPVLGLEHVVGRRTAYLMEGPFDWLAAVGWQLPAFAICGTHFPSERLAALQAATVIYGVFDPDRAGQSAAERFAPLFGSRWRPIRLPNNVDLAELATMGEAGREMFRSLVGRARAMAWQDSRF